MNAVNWTFTEVILLIIIINYCYYYYYYYYYYIGADMETAKHNSNIIVKCKES